MIDVIICGCGSIGALKANKYDSPQSKNILTWANAFHRLKSHNISLFFIDENERRSKLAAKKWDGTFYDNINHYNKFRDGRRKAIYIIATPTDTHKDMIVEIMKYDHTLLVVEKPFCKDYPEALFIDEIYKRPILINYSRRFLPITYTMKQMIKSGFLGKIQQCKITYVRGFKRDASHAIDLLNYFFGKCIDGEILNWKSAIIDWDESDPTYSAYLEYENCPEVFITGCNGGYFDIFEIDIISEKARHTFVDHGKKLIAHLPVPEPTYGDYKTLVDGNNHVTDTKLTEAFFYTTQNILDHVSTDGRTKLQCTISDALEVHKVFNMLGV